MFSLVAAVGKPLQVDLAAQNKTRPSCARVKVEVDLLGEFSKRINIGTKIKTGKIREKWVSIRYDYVSKYCKNCKLQGHNEKECYILHHDLCPKEEDGDTKEKSQEEQHHEKIKKVRNEEDKTTLEDREKKKFNNDFQQQRRKGGYRRSGQNQRERMGKTWNPKLPDVAIDNKFEALGDNGQNSEEDKGDKKQRNNKESED